MSMARTREWMEGERVSKWKSKWETIRLTKLLETRANKNKRTTENMSVEWIGE